MALSPHPSKRRQSMHDREGGSVFVEAMIAAAIVAVALGATFRTIGESARRTRLVEARRAALMVAQSELASVGADIPLRLGHTSGTNDGLLWRVDIEPYADGVDHADVGDLWRIAVVVRARDGGDLAALDTLRLGPVVG